MLTFEDCLALCDIDEDEIVAIVEHEGVPAIIALEMGHYLCHCENGEPCLERMILDDIAEAGAKGDLARVARLRRVLRHFVQTHPRARGGESRAGPGNKKVPC